MTYKEFIDTIIRTRGKHNISDTKNFEKHHIVPVCCGGEGDYKNHRFKSLSTHDNCIWLYPKEHFIAHKLLALENPNNYKLVFAWHAMWIQDVDGRRYEPTPEEYEEHRRLINGVSIPEEICQLHANPGEKNGMFGKHHSDETREKLRQANLGKKMHWWTNGVEQTMAEACPGDGWYSGRLKGFHDKKKRVVSKKPKQKQYLWQLPNGEIRQMSKFNVTKWHPDWILLQEVKEGDHND